jgi:hypothetical protein
LSEVEVIGCPLPNGLMGLVKDRGKYLAAMRVSLTRDPWLQSHAEREVAGDDWARVVASLPIETVDRLQALTVSRKGVDDGLLADASAAEGPGLEVLKEVASYLASHDRQFESVLVIRLSQAAARDALRRGGEEIIGQTLHSVLQHLGGQLPSEQLEAEILAPADWIALLRSILEVTEEPIEDAETGLFFPQPQERWDSVAVGQTIHRVMWIWQWPQRPMAAGFLAPLLTGGGNRVVSMLVAPAEPEPHQRSIDWAYRRAQAALETARSSRHRKQADLDSLDRQLRELNEGHVPIRVLATVAVSGRTSDEVEDLTGMVRTDAIAGSCRVASFDGSQVRGLLRVLPLCRGLDQGVDG